MFHRYFTAYFLAAFTGCTPDPDRDASLNHAQVTVEPVMVAIQTYHTQQHRYPSDLYELVTAKLLPAVPEMPAVRGTLGKPFFGYEVSDDRSRFYLHVGYTFPGGLGPADSVARYYRSDYGHWGTSKYPPSLRSERELKERERVNRDRPNA